MKPVITEHRKSKYYDKDQYIVTVDLEQKKKKTLTGANGEYINLIIKVDTNQNHRISHPNYATVESTSENTQFRKGDTIICNHFTFEDANREAKIYYSKDDVDYFKVTNLDLMFGVVNNELVCREGILLCEGVNGKLLDTSLEMLDDYDGRRRDIAKVLKVWDGCEEYKVGDYVILAKGGDYEFEHDKVNYLKVDTYFDDVLAICDSVDYRLTEIRQHAKHNEVKQL